MRLRGGDRGALVVPGIVKIAVALGVLGVLGYDTFETIATHLKAESDAQNAAYAGSSAWTDDRVNGTSNITLTPCDEKFLSSGGESLTERAYCAADAFLGGSNAADHLCGMPGDHLCDGHNTIPCSTGASSSQPSFFCIDPDGTVHLIVRREANTLVFSHLGFMHRFLVAYEQGDANSQAD